MCMGIAIRSARRSLMVAISVFGCFLFLPQPARAQRVLAQDASASTPQPNDSAKPTLPALPSPTVHAAAPTPPHAFWDRTNVALFSGIAVTRAMDYASTRNFQ